MKVLLSINVDIDEYAEIGIDEIHAVLAEQRTRLSNTRYTNGESFAAVAEQMAFDVDMCLKAIDDAMINSVNYENRRIIADCLQKEADRWNPT